MEQSNHWKPVELLFIFLLIAVGFLLRYYQLDIRPIHHDESLHGVYSLYYLENSTTGFYRYDPLLHGPLLYHIVPWFFYFLGVTKFALRLPAVLLGSMLFLIPLLLRRFLSKATCLTLLTLIVFSPSLVYWSRFIRHDSFLLFGVILVLIGALSRVPLIKVMLIGLGFGLQFSAKENSFIHLLFLVVYLIYEIIVGRVFELNHKSLSKRIGTFIANHPLYTFLGFVLFVGVFLHYYTAGFIYWQGALDGLYRKSIIYWFDQHHQERISGPFSYPFLINTFFESWWVPALIIHLYGFYQRQTWNIKIAFAFSLLFGALTHFMVTDNHFKDFVSTYLKCKIPLDYYLFFPLIFHAVVAPTTYLLENRQERAFTAFLFFASLFTYSYLGEKVPWLALYPLITGLIFMSFEFDRTFHWPIAVVFIALLIHMGWTTYWTNYSHRNSPENLLTQVHTTEEFEAAMLEISSQMQSKPQGKGPYLLVKDQGTWPSTWFFHGRKEYHYLPGIKPLKDYDYILGKTNDDELNGILKGSYNKEIIPFRAWWVPQYQEMSVLKLWRYFLKKEPWNGSGRGRLALWIKKPLLDR